MKNIKYLIVFIATFILSIGSVFADSYEISVTSNSVTVGNSVTLKITASNAAGKFTITSSNSSVVSVSTSTVWIDSSTQSITLKANKAGSATITVTPTDVTGYNGGTITGSVTKTITVKEKSTSSSGSSSSSSGNSSSANSTTTAKSANSYLTSITIDGIDLDSKFDKETLEYTATAPAGTEKVKINAQLENSNSKVTGTGEVSVSAGVNTFSLVVTAENGSKRTYTVKITVLELTPIEVTVDKQSYSVVRERKDLPDISDYFEETEVTIDDEVVEGYYNEKLDYTVVGLKSEDGEIEYYIYKDNQFTQYKEYVFNGTVLQIIDKSVDDGYKEVSFNYDGDEIKGYQAVKLDILKNTYALDNDEITGNQFYLFYAKNVETGEENLYQYDSVEKTVQRYNLEIIDMYKKRSDTYYMYLLGCLLTLGVVIITICIVSICKKRKKNKKRSKIDSD